MKQKIQEIEGFIREEIGDSKSCIIVGEARDELKKEQIAVALRFVDKEELIGSGQLEIGKGKNQVGILQRPGNTDGDLI
ncbi:hypothetical protein J1N35_035180 [Gossypium stocksii]|uniref:Uncharacterized protein n=1 Tax=Gossypium stocksii TaxID=47602 RepID=A0A9D3ZRF0_9ROSI|nr:hypothetical protein J1N35_035180 [Gossypium stocksii]